MKASSSSYQKGTCWSIKPNIGLARNFVQFSVRFSHSVVSNSLQPHRLQHARPPCPSPTARVYSIKLMSIESVMPSNHLILCRPILLLPTIFPIIRVFSNESALRIRWPKYWSFSFNISPSNEHSGLISFRMDWLDLHAVQGTLKSLLQHHSSKASILWHSAFLIVQLSHPYMTTGKTIALTRRIFVGKIMSLLFKMPSRLVITFLPRSKRLLISWLQSLSAVILEPKKIKSLTVSIVSPSICHEVIGLDAMILVFWMLSVKPAFSLSSFTFFHKGGVICISEVIDISPGHLDSSLCFFQSSVSHDVLCIEVPQYSCRHWRGNSILKINTFMPTCRPVSHQVSGYCGFAKVTH